MRKVEKGHYVSEAEGFSVYLVKKREKSDFLCKSGRTLASSRWVSYWAFKVKGREASNGWGSKKSALAAARKVLEMEAALDDFNYVGSRHHH